MKDYSRMQRVDSLIQNTLSEILLRYSKDRGLGFVSVTNLKVTKDLSLAKVYILTHDEVEGKEIVKHLNESTKNLRHELAQSIMLRKVPELHFYYDDVESQGVRITELLQEEEEKLKK